MEWMHVRHCSPAAKRISPGTITPHVAVRIQFQHELRLHSTPHHSSHYCLSLPSPHANNPALFQHKSRQTALNPPSLSPWP